jgi:Protein of unknown function (DUF2975)
VVGVDRDDQHERALRPASTAAGFALILIGALVFAGLVAVGLGNGSIFNWGDANACADLTAVTADWTVNGDEVPVRPGADAFPGSGIRVCAEQASRWQHVLASLSQGSLWTVHVIGLIMLVLLLRVAGRRGPFHASTARAVGRLGWWLLLATPVAAVVQAVSGTAMFATLSTRPVGLMSWLPEVQPPFAAMITGAAVLSVARLWRIGTGMRAEIEATV